MSTDGIGANTEREQGRCTNPRRDAVTGRQLELVIAAASKTLSRHAPGERISPRKVGKLVQRFNEALKRHHMTFHEYLSYAANNPPVDYGLRCLLGYLDPTGEKAARNVDRLEKVRHMTHRTEDHA